jgi:hypothetical protein
MCFRHRTSSGTKLAWPHFSVCDMAILYIIHQTQGRFGRDRPFADPSFANGVDSSKLILFFAGGLDLVKSDSCWINELGMR